MSCAIAESLNHNVVEFRRLFIQYRAAVPPVRVFNGEFAEPEPIEFHDSRNVVSKSSDQCIS
jgi:hypothetical protein